jgi:hypothetical protein
MRAMLTTSSTLLDHFAHVAFCVRGDVLEQREPEHEGHCAPILKRPDTRTSPEERRPHCCLCWLDGVWSPPIKCWDGIPICREHLAEIVEKNSPSLPMQARGFAAPSTALH